MIVLLIALVWAGVVIFLAVKSAIELEQKEQQ